MHKSIVENINFVQFLVVVTFIVHTLTFNKKKENHRLLLIILLLCFLNELASLLFILMNISYSLLFTVSVMIHNALWLFVISKVCQRESIYILLFYFVFAFLNLLFVEGFVHFNYNTFIAGALLFIIIFISESFVRLKNEAFSFFSSNDYILIFAPVLFFFGLSFIFGFRSDVLSEKMLFGNVNLYEFINISVNLVYYTLINVYIYREKRIKNAT